MQDRHNTLPIVELDRLILPIQFKLRVWQLGLDSGVRDWKNAPTHLNLGSAVATRWWPGSAHKMRKSYPSSLFGCGVDMHAVSSFRHRSFSSMSMVHLGSLRWFWLLLRNLAFVFLVMFLYAVAEPHSQHALLKRAELDLQRTLSLPSQLDRLPLKSRLYINGRELSKVSRWTRQFMFPTSPDRLQHMRGTIHGPQQVAERFREQATRRPFHRTTSLVHESSLQKAPITEHGRKAVREKTGKGRLAHLQGALRDQGRGRKDFRFDPLGDRLWHEHARARDYLRTKVEHTSKRTAEKERQLMRLMVSQSRDEPRTEEERQARNAMKGHQKEVAAEYNTLGSERHMLSKQLQRHTDIANALEKPQSKEEKLRELQERRQRQASMKHQQARQWSSSPSMGSKRPRRYAMRLFQPGSTVPERAYSVEEYGGGQDKLKQGTTPRR